MNQHDYDFLTGQWTGPKGAAYNETFEFCRQFGWCVGFDTEGGVVLTKHGVKAIKAFQAEENYKRIDVI